MTPQERQMVADLFERLASLEGNPRDPDAERGIREGLARAPNAVYALVQTVLLQEEALKRANTRIEELEHAVNPGPAQTQSGGFLDSMRNVFAGQSRGSVPSVRTGGQTGGQPGSQGSSGVWGNSPPPPPPPPGYQQQGYPPPPGYMQGPPMGAPMMGGGGSFLGTAAATAAGVIGGSMLLNGIRNAFGAGGSHQTFGSGYEGGGGFGSSSPWGGSGGGELSREAGVGDIGRRGGNDDLARQDALQDAQQDADDDNYSDDYSDDAGDYSDDGGMDTA